MNKFIERLTTGKDNQTPDLGRWSWIISLTLVSAAAMWMIAKESQAFSLRELAEALGIVSASHGVAIFAKKDTEPNDVENNTQ